MPPWPSLGSRVSIRYRVGGAHTDVIGYLRAVAPRIEVHTKSSGPVFISPDDVVAVRELSHTVVRASEIRALEHAAALAWPGTQHHWHRGWLLRAAGGHTSRANSAVPLDFSAAIADLDDIVSWYGERGLTPWLALPDRLVRVRAAGVKRTRVMVRDIDPAGLVVATTLRNRPDAAWLNGYRLGVPEEVLTAVIDGEVTFASIAGAAGGRGAPRVSPAPARARVQPSDVITSRSSCKTISLQSPYPHGALGVYGDYTRLTLQPVHGTLDGAAQRAQGPRYQCTLGLSAAR